MKALYDPEAHKARIQAEADEAYKATYATQGAYEAYWARRRVYGYTYPGDNYSRLGVVRCDRPMLAPMTRGSLAEDLSYPDTRSPFPIDRIESHFGDSMVWDTFGRAHEIENVRVIEYLSPADFEQRKQDQILARLEAAYI